METATFVLMGLRYEDAIIERLFQGVQEMEESTTYQLILRRGEERGATQSLRETILQLGRLKFGEPSAEQAESLEGITDRVASAH